jgi:hypothetical protein
MLNNHDDTEEYRLLREQARQAELSRRREDELLQVALAAMELGQPLDDALEGLARQQTPETVAPAGDLQDLQNLLQLAAALRSLPHPAPQLDWSKTLDAHLAVQAGLVRPNGHNHSHERIPRMQPEPITKPRRQAIDERRTTNVRNPSSVARRPSFVLRPAYVFLTGLAVMLVFAITLAGLGVYLAGPRSAQAATLMDAQGQVEVMAPDGTWNALATDG